MGGKLKTRKETKTLPVQEEYNFSEKAPLSHNSHENSASPVQKEADLGSKRPPLSVDEMTSADFQHDLNAHIDVAAQLLKDRVRIQHFQAAILHNKHLFHGRTVLDIGSGIGILSLFAAKAGAKRVFSVNSSNVAEYTRRIVQANGYEGVITVIKGRIDEVELPVQHIDIIVCDWMGYSLLFQSTCDAVIYARDKWLRKGSGLIFPDVAKLFMSAIEDNKHRNDRVEWWTDVYGFNMKCLREFALSEPRFAEVRPQQILSSPFAIKTLNLNTAKSEDLKFRSKYMFDMQRSGLMDGVVTYFYVQFSKSHTPAVHSFSTDPWSPSTNWMQTVLYFDQPRSVNVGQKYYGGIEMYSTAKGKCDLNMMEMGIEMFSGDPMQMRLEAEMSWQLKPHAAAAAPAVSTGVAKISRDAVETSYPSVNPPSDTSNLTKSVQSDAVATTIPTNKNNVKIDHNNNNVSNKNGYNAALPKCCIVKIGKEPYICKAERTRKKNKHSKKC